MYLICHVTSHDRFIEGSCEFMGESSLSYVTTLIVLVTISNVIMEIILTCHMTSHEQVSRVMWIYCWKPLTENHYLPMTGGHWSSVSGDIKLLICHVTSQNHVIEGSSNLSENSSWYVTTLLTLVSHRYCSCRNVFSLSRDQARPRD